MEKIIWTALPHEVSDNKLSISVFVSMRLGYPSGQASGVLKDFPTILDWPITINKLEFDVAFTSGPTIRAKRLKPQVDKKWWNKLFTEDTPVISHQIPDYKNVLVRTFPVTNVLDFIQKTYSQIAREAPTNHPSIDPTQSSLATQFKELIDVVKIPNENEKEKKDYLAYYLEELDAELKTQVEGTSKLRRALPPGSPIYYLNPTQSDFLRAYRFYSRPEQKQQYSDPLTASKIPNPPKLPSFDFHQMLAVLGDFPRILRELGIIIDLEIDLDSAELEGLPDIPLAGKLQIIPTLKASSSNGVDLHPHTCYYLTENRFLPKPLASPLLKDGMLALEDQKRFRVYQMDIDGAALKIMGYAKNLRNLLKPITDPAQISTHTPTSVSVPSLRSAGITVAATQRAWDLVQQLDRNELLNTDLELDNASVGAEELLRGFRIDIFDADPNKNKWYSLMRRVGKPKFLGSSRDSNEETMPEMEDEGYLKATAATSTRLDVTDPTDPNKPGKDDFYLHEALFGWDGWSLIAPRPGKIISEPGQGETPERNYAQEDPGTISELPLENLYRVAKGSLPSLRFGRKYRVRARTVDIAGNSLPFVKDHIDRHASEEITYLRYEPVSSPAIVRQHLDTEGESLEHMVIRSNYDKTSEEYVISPSAAAYNYTTESRRHVAPPKTSQQMAEQLGMFDYAFGAHGNPAEAFNIALREEGTFLDTDVVDTATGRNPIDVSADIGVFPETTPAPTRGRTLSDGAYIYRKGDKLLLPYLPDPLAIGAVFYNLPGRANKAYEVNFHKDPDWPEIKPFRIILHEGKGPDQSQAHSEYDDVNNVLEIYLPKAERVDVRYNSLLDDEGRSKMAIWNSLNEQEQHDFIQKGEHLRHWMIAPYRILELVHAVQQPLSEPVTNVLPVRSLGDTSCSFSGVILNHAKSTIRLDVYAEWSEPVDRVKEDGPSIIEGSAHAFGFEIGPAEDKAKATIPYWCPVCKREMNIREICPIHKVYAEKGRVSRHEFGDTKHRKVTYWTIGTTRFREYFNPEIAKEPKNIQREGPKVELNIPSSSRPAPPKLMYIIPTFKWEKRTIENTIKQVRKGGGLRVYLDRPWFSSGDDEVLGVVLPQPLPTVKMVQFKKLEKKIDPQKDAAYFQPVGSWPTISATEVENALPYVTKWGKDPTWKTGDPYQVPLTSHFKLSLPSSRGYLSLAEAKDSVVAVAAHEVEYDCERKLWFCDIEIDAGASYFPFVRLALARYQPNSIANAHLSPVVIADFIQLTADRTATINFQNQNVAIVTVSGIAPHNIVAEQAVSMSSALGEGMKAIDKSKSRRVSVTLQKRDPQITGDLAWKDIGKEVFLPIISKNQEDTIWQGKIIFPEKIDKDTNRLIVKEYEYFFTDFDPEKHQVISLTAGSQGYTRNRIVYADVINLNPPKF